MDEYNPALRAFFDGIDASELAAMQVRREEEGLRLDFKRGSKDGEPSKDDLANLRKAVSGFANSEGGVILWGVESKRDGDRADRNCFAKIEPISDGAKFVARLQEVTGNATSPPVNGVVHRAIAVEGGFVVKTFVPASDYGPHQDARELVYWRRYADRFRAMQDFEIRDMFGRRARPILDLVTSGIQFNQFFGPKRPGVTMVLVGILNTGRAVARFPKLVIAPKEGAVEPWQYGIDGNGTTGLPRSPRPSGSKDFHFVGSVNEVIHPESVLEVSKFGLEASTDGRVSLEYRIYADGMNFVEGTRTFSADELREPPKPNR